MFPCNKQQKLCREADMWHERSIMEIYSPKQRHDGKVTQISNTLSNLSQQATRRNVAPAERWLSALVGGALAGYGIARRGWSGTALVALGSELLYRGISGHSFIYQMLGRNTAEQQFSLSNILLLSRGPQACAQRSLTINRSPEELYTFWRKLENAPRFIPNVISVTQTGTQTSHWVASGPRNHTYEWDAELITDEPWRCIAWRTIGKPLVASAGSVHFTLAPGGRGTVVTLGLDNVNFKG